MGESRPTYETAAPSIRPYVQELWPGALAPAFQTRDEQGRPLALADDHLSGRWMILLFLGDPDAAHTPALLRSLAALEEGLDAAEATVLAVSASSDASRNRALKRASGFPWPLVCDASGGLFASYGLHKGSDRDARLVVLTPFRQIRCWFDLAGDDAAPTLAKVIEMLDDVTTTGELHWSPPHAPVLIVPNVLSGEECGRLVEAVETDTPFMVRRPGPGEIAGNYRIPVYEYDRQDRTDLIVKDPSMLAFLDDRLFGRVTPMIRKAFAFEVTRREDLHIARYAGQREGFAIGHRDNTSPPGAHRRFALSLSLNDDYEGGGIVFREFSPRPYRVPAGTAMVFSSSLLHEVEETVSGVRYNLISHLFS